MKSSSRIPETNDNLIELSLNDEMMIHPDDGVDKKSRLRALGAPNLIQTLFNRYFHLRFFVKYWFHTFPHVVGDRMDREPLQGWNNG
jgi:hypothetical protein